MKSKFMTVALFLFISIPAYCQPNKTITVSASEPDTKIFVDGREMGEGVVMVKVMGGGCVNLSFERSGYVTKKKMLCNQKDVAKLPKSYFQQMDKDESFDASIKNDLANTDIEIETSKKEEEAWKLISQIVLSGFDVLEITDKETGYLRTSWVTQTFQANTIRTRIIIKQSSVSPLKYKVKLCSEQSGKAHTSVKEDEQFKQWDRILRKYETIITELQTRLK